MKKLSLHNVCRMGQSEDHLSGKVKKDGVEN